MKYSKSNTKIELGDRVIVDFDVIGIVVCDFESWTCLEGYEEWLVKDKLVGDGYLSNGVMIKTEKIGFLHCAEESANIQPA